jgi:hypothetical protein
VPGGKPGTGTAAVRCAGSARRAGLPSALAAGAFRQRARSRGLGRVGVAGLAGAAAAIATGSEHGSDLLAFVSDLGRLRLARALAGAVASQAAAQQPSELGSDHRVVGDPSAQAAALPPSDQPKR